ncbi:MAG: hypothetical protein KF768_07160 [Phycisphaeraceae bacterium]|nr:hypothetical protein [Phycisphaeraceae bacterium]
MKNATAWLKSNWLIVVLCLVAIAALPAAIVVSMGMSTKLREEVQKKLNEDYNAVNSNKVAYYVPLLTGERKLERNTEVNPLLNDLYAKAYEAFNAKGIEAARVGEAFNKGNHELLVDGFFPAPDRLVEATKRTEFLRRYSRTFHEGLLQRMRAGMPPSAIELSEVMRQHLASHLERLTNERGSSEMNDDESIKLQNEMFAIRLGRYRSRAAEISIYADLSSFDGVAAVDPTAPLSMLQAWDLQERAWLHSDVVKAIEHVNGGGSAGGGVQASIVKRLLRVAPDRAVFEGGGVAQFDPGTDRAPVNYSRSLTGRVSGPGSQNRWYDLRVVTLEFIASSRRLPEFIDALASTNFITVLELDLAAVDVFDDLRHGFYYGDEHIVRVTMRLESVMLRSWRTASMPQDVKKALGIAEGESGGQDGYTPPPPPRREEYGEG